MEARLGCAVIVAAVTRKIFAIMTLSMHRTNVTRGHDISKHTRVFSIARWKRDVTWPAAGHSHLIGIGSGSNRAGLAQQDAQLRRIGRHRHGRLLLPAAKRCLAYVHNQRAGADQLHDDRSI